MKNKADAEANNWLMIKLSRNKIMHIQIHKDILINLNSRLNQNLIPFTDAIIN